MKRFYLTLIAFILLMSPSVLAASISDYLILDDIGSYKLITESVDPLFNKVVQTSGYTIEENHPGIIVATGHFTLDHSDITYSTDYESDTADLGVEVQVTRHAGAESDKWLLHELEDGYRDDEALNAAADTNVRIRTIDDNNVYFIGIYGGKSYSWISNNIVVDISCSSCPNIKPEPIEIVKAYLARHPSTITLTDADMQSSAHNETWIKDEMERRLWLCDKWLMQLQLGKAGQAEVLKEAVEHMGVFLNYREKYYGVSGEKERDLLDDYLGHKSGSEIKNRLEALKQWWAKNKENPINL